jgi:hypothetical protein
MPAKDTFHEHVKTALVKDGWTITHDPYTTSLGQTKVFSDLGAERPIAAERGDQKIAVEIKSFLGVSPVRELEQALGQFVLYDTLIRSTQPERQLYPAVPDDLYKSLLDNQLGQSLRDTKGLAIVTFDPDCEEIVRWVK